MHAVLGLDLQYPVHLLCRFPPNYKIKFRSYVFLLDLFVFNKDYIFTEINFSWLRNYLIIKDLP